jgi:hypothetical protein
MYYVKRLCGLRGLLAGFFFSRTPTIGVVHLGRFTLKKKKNNNNNINT